MDASAESRRPRSGWHSSKLHLSLITMAVLTVGWLVMGATEGTYGEWAMGVIAAAGIYSSSRVAESFASRAPGGR